MLSFSVAQSLFPSKVLGESLYLFNDLPSTNSLALELAKKEAPEGTLILANTQSQGRGRLGRTWHSPSGNNIYASLIMYGSRNHGALGWIPLLTGLALVRTIQEVLGLLLHLKWPNDLLLDDRKTGGILCESLQTESGRTGVVIGLGLNINLAQNSLPEELRATVTSLEYSLQKPIDLSMLLPPLIHAIEKEISLHSPSNIPGLLKEYVNRCSTMGKTVQVTYPNGHQIRGVAQSIGNEGQLQIYTDTLRNGKPSREIIEVHSGDILHLR